MNTVIIIPARYASTKPGCATAITACSQADPGRATRNALSIERCTVLKPALRGVTSEPTRASHCVGNGDDVHS